MAAKMVSLVIASIVAILRGLMVLTSFPNPAVKRSANSKFRYAAIPVRDDPIYSRRRHYR